MRKQLAHSGIGIIIFYLLISGCTKHADGITGPAGPGGTPGLSVSDSRSAITGYLKLVSQFALPETADDSITVSTLMGDSLITVKTDKSGKFILPALKAGTYRILFQRNHYDSIAVTVTHTAGNEDKFIGIVEMDGTLTTKILHQELELKDDPFTPGQKFLDIRTTIDGPPLEYSTRRYYSVLLYGSAAGVTPPYQFEFQTYTENEGSHKFKTQVYYQSSDINSSHFNAGDTIYVKTVFTPPYSLLTSWFDTNTYRSVPYPYNGDSSVNYFIWPN